MKLCVLCGRYSAIKNSHIVPKFVVKRLKATTPHGTLRHSNELARVAQDGWKGEYLCLECEGTFSQWERWFCREVYDPFLAGTRTSFPMTPELALFAASVHFRYIEFVLDRKRVTEAPPDVANLRALLRQVCLERAVPAQGLHMYLEFESPITDPAFGFLPGINTYLSTTLDGSLFQCVLPEEGVQRVSFVKFPSVLLFCSEASLVGSKTGDPVPTEIKTTGSLDAGAHEPVLLSWMHAQCHDRARGIQESYPLLPQGQYAKNVAKIKAAPNIEQYPAHQAYLADQKLHAAWMALQSSTAEDDAPPAPAGVSAPDATV